MTAAVEFTFGALALAFFIWLFRRIFRWQAPAEPVDDPFASVPVPRKPRPKGRSGAVALEEPDDD